MLLGRREGAQAAAFACRKGCSHGGPTTARWELHYRCIISNIGQRMGPEMPGICRFGKLRVEGEGDVHVKGADRNFAIPA